MKDGKAGIVMIPNKNYSEEYALSFLPHRIAESVRKAAALYRGNINEVRLRTDCPVYITAGNKNVKCSAGCTQDEMLSVVRALCGNSLYCHSETIKEGYICTSCGLRAGVCGRAVTENGKIISVTDITSVSIRIPHRYPGAADGLCRLICDSAFKGMIIYSPPGGGKTTALREICARLAAPPYSLRIAAVDTRFEICGGLGGDLSVDALCGYPRAKGMETAVRTLSPQLIVCDEIGSAEDAAAVGNSFGAGVPCVVSAHAASVEELYMKDYMKQLCESGAFSCAVGLGLRDGKFMFDITSLECARRSAAPVA